MPKISVVMPVYNGQAHLADSVESILNQTEKDFEFIIIDDGSTDATPVLLHEFEKRDNRIKVLTRKNRGVVASLNEAVALAESDYIARMDADDISLPQRLATQYVYMKENNLVLCGTYAEGIDQKGKHLRDMTYPPTSDTLHSFTMLHNPMIHPSVMFKKEIFKKVGGYNGFFKHIEDYELWTRIVFKYKAGNVPTILLKYRFHNAQVTKKHQSTMKVYGVIVRILAVLRRITRL